MHKAGFLPVHLLQRLALVSCVVVMAACDSNSVSQHMSQAEQHFEARQYDEAIVELKLALGIANEQQETLPEARWMLGMSYLKTGDMMAAAKELTRAKDLGWNRDEVLPSLAKALLRNGELTQAMELSTAGLDPKIAARLQIQQAQALLELGDVWTADTYINKAAELLPGNIEVALTRAQILGASGDTDGALAAINRALKERPEKHHAWSYKGDLLTLKQQLPEALEAYNTAIKLSPRNREYRLKRGLLNLHQQQLRRVAPDLKFLLVAAPKSAITNYLKGSVDFHNGAYANSIVALTLARPAAQQHPLILFYLAGAYLAEGYEEEALRQAERQVSLNPDFAPGRILLASLYIKNSQAADAQHILRPVLYADPTDTLSLNLMAKALLLDDKQEQALKILETVQEIEPDSANAHFELGAGLLSAGQGEAANRQFEAALTLDPTLEQAALLRIQYLHQIEDFSNAIVAAQNNAHHHPESVLAHNLLGQNYLANEQVEEAAAAFEKALSLAPGDPAANHALALIEQGQGNTAASRARYQTVLAEKPDHLPTLLHQAVLAAEPGNESEMAAQLQYAIEVHPGALEPRLMLARYYLWENKPGKIPALLAMLPEAKRQSPEALHLTAVSQISQQLYSKAMYNLEKLVKSRPGSALVHHLLGTAAAGTGDMELAKAELQHAAELDENFAPTIVSLARLAWFEGDTDRFNRYLKRLSRLAPDAPDVLRLQAIAAQRDGNPEQAIALSRQALQRSPGTKVMLELAGYHHASGNSEGAQQVVQDWISNHPTDAEARLVLATQLADAGQIKDATLHFQEVVKQQPQNTLALNFLAEHLWADKPQEVSEFAQLDRIVKPGKTEVLEALALVESNAGNQQEALQQIRRGAQAAENRRNLPYHQAMIQSMSGNKATAIEILRSVLDVDSATFAPKDNTEQLLASLQNVLAENR
ncbi:Beta-barrel assembly-enhancing protease [Halioglobus japonicus]|nr:Beta-barrel assembly-enhancing protease [Halioglobus japonicus]